MDEWYDAVWTQVALAEYSLKQPIFCTDNILWFFPKDEK